MYGIYHIKGNTFIKFSNSLRGIKITLARWLVIIRMLVILRMKLGRLDNESRIWR
jgi:hypothetical protein